jgi:hypothetical protein
MSQMDTRNSAPFKSTFEPDQGFSSPNIESTNQYYQAQGDSRSEDKILLKDRQISQLQEDKRRLEADLEEVKVFP